jgi:hypothetical protein
VDNHVERTGNVVSLPVLSDQQWICDWRVMTTKANSVKKEIFRLQTHYEVQGFIERAKDEGLAEDDAIEALEQAIEDLKEFRERARDAISGGRLF